MNIKLGALSAFALVCLLQPLLRFTASPSFETGRAVDLLLVFAAGMSAGVVLVALKLHRRA